PIFGSKAHFVGGHPVAGSERVGVEHAKADLFDNATWILTPTPETPKDSIEKLQRLIEAIGAKPLVMDAVTHDSLLAVTSHLPHISASLLVHLFMQTQDNYAVVEQLIAGGWRDSTRVAAGSPEMWRDICLANSEALIQNVDRMAEALGEVRQMLEEKNADVLQDWFASAAAVRRKQGYFPR
ncbi:MAG: prephenate dehydrogenase/arogenate dehydrogenase family protein, partial [Abditibacteriaceae bacterium]